MTSSDAPGWGPARAAGIALLLAALLPCGAFAQPLPAAHEEEVKAAYLYNIAKFVDWPASAFPKASTAFGIGVVADPELAAVLRSTMRGKKVQGHPIEVHHFGVGEPSGKCHILFVGPDGDSALQSKSGASSRGVLSVGEGEDFVRNGGAIGFYVERESLRFAICPENATRAGLTISSKLLRLAKVLCK